MPSPFGGLTSIGVDETSYRKGHTCITVVVDHERHRAIWAHDGYGRDVFGLFFQTLTPEQRASIRVVAGDGARWIDSCVHEWCPNAERAPDGFHIVRWTSGAPDNPRKQQKPHMYWTFLRREGGVTAALRCENARLRSWALTVEPAIMAQATIATRRY